MSKEYERRLELEALPAEPGYTKWQGVIGYATVLVERKQLAPVTIWVAKDGVPREVEAYRYENWRFAKETDRWFSYTQWHTNTEYTDYSMRSSRLDSMCAHTREELCTKALALLNTELEQAQKAVAKLEATRAKFQ